LNAVCLDTGGRVVGCNGQILFHKQATGLEAIPAQTLLGPIEGLDFGGRNGATLEVGADEATFRDGDGPFMTTPLMGRRYVDYEEVIPRSWACSVRVKADGFVEMVERMGPFLEPMHEVTGAGWVYTPRVEFLLDAAARRMSLLTGAKIGYHCPKPAPKSAPKAQAVEPALEPVGMRSDWVFRTSTDAEFEGDAVEAGVGRVAVNHKLLKLAVDSLGLGDDDWLVIRFKGENKALVLGREETPHDFALVMPLRLEEVGCPVS
jgi:hypothetical protein